MNKHQTRRLLGTLVVALIPLAVSGLQGCSAMKNAGIVPVNPAENPAQGPLAVDVDNYRGTVTVEVNPKLKEPIVLAVPRGGDRSHQWTAATMAVDAGHPVLRVLSTEPSAGAGPAIDITIRVPQCAGVRVRNEGGQVTLRDVEGAIDAQTSVAERGNGAILVETVAPLTEPVLLRTQRGRIELRMPVRSAGAIRAEAPSGHISVDATRGRLKNVRFENHVWTGGLNDGTADMHLSTDDGDIVVSVGR